jgi:hypothetical protein
MNPDRRRCRGARWWVFTKTGRGREIELDNAGFRQTAMVVLKNPFLMPPS